jgi:hypothetical protein
MPQALYHILVYILNTKQYTRAVINLSATDWPKKRIIWSRAPKRISVYWMFKMPFLYVAPGYKTQHPICQRNVTTSCQVSMPLLRSFVTWRRNGRQADKDDACVSLAMHCMGPYVRICTRVQLVPARGYAHTHTSGKQGISPGSLGPSVPVAQPGLTNRDPIFSPGCYTNRD